MGNAVLLKPSELTPLTSLALGLLAEKAGLPKGVVNVLAGFGHTTGQAAMAQPAVKKVVFVGSVPTGRLIAESAARLSCPACWNWVASRRTSCSRMRISSAPPWARRRPSSRRGAELRRRLAPAGAALGL